jgi:uncharacterized membrane protein
MSETRGAWTDQQIDNIIGALLRLGVIVAALVVLAGGILYLYRYGAAAPAYRVFHGEPSDLRSVRGILSDAISLRSRGIIQFGLLLLIATPLVRVAFTVIAFALQRDRTYVTVTLIVLALLLYSLIGATH